MGGIDAHHQKMVGEIIQLFEGEADVLVVGVAFDPPNGMVIESVSDGLDAITEVDLIALSQSRTRVMVSIDLKARTLTARLLLQSLKLAKTRLGKRFKGRVVDFCEDVEDRYRREA